MIYFQSGYTPATPNHARIGWQNLTYGKTPTASTSATGFPAIAATYPTTFEFWRPTAIPATWAVDMLSAVPVDYVGIVGDLNGATVYIDSSSDNFSTFTTQMSATPGQRINMFLFAEVSARYWRVRVDGQIPNIAVIYIGKSLTMQRGIYQGHTPLTLSRETELSNNMSDGGQWLGRSIIRRGATSQAAWAHLTSSWYRANFDPFVESARVAPFFFGWRPSSYPAEMGFVWTDGDIAPSNSGPRDYMSVDISVRGLINE